MTTTYTTNSIVSDRLKNISSDLTTTKIDENINHAEGIIDAVMGMSGLSGREFTFDATKHGIIRDTATCIAAFLCLMYDVEEMATSSTAQITADLLWAEIDRNLAILSNSEVRYWIRKV